MPSPNIDLSHPEPEERDKAIAARAEFFPRDDSLARQLRAYLAETPGSSMAKLRSEIGYSGSVLSQYLHEHGNKYRGDTAGLERSIREFLRDQRLIVETGVETIPTTISKQLEEALEDIRTSKGLGVIIGAPGIGKTRGIALYCESHSNAISFCAWSGECNRRSAELLLFEAADIARLKPGTNKARLLVERLRGTSRLLIVDDAHKLTRPALQLLYDFRDRTGMPLALIGDERLIPKLADDGQRLRRTGGTFQLRLKRVKRGEKIIEIPDQVLIDHHITALLPDDANEEANEIRALCATIAARAGHYGSVQMELARAARLRKSRPEWSWCEAIKRAHKRLIRDYEL